MKSLHRTCCEHLQWLHSQTRDTCCSAPSSAPKRCLLPGQVAWFPAREPPPSHPQLPGHHRSLPRLRSLGERFCLLNVRGLLRMQRGFSLLFPSLCYCPAPLRRWSLSLICKYSEPINSPVPATYPPSCKTLSVPSKWQTEVPTQLELLGDSGMVTA